MIRIPQAFTDSHKIIARQFVQGEKLDQSERRLLFETFDLLHKAEIEVNTGRLTFAQVYEQYIEFRFANEYLSSLIQIDNIESSVERLRSQVSKQIMPVLRDVGLLDQNEPLSFYLLAYCLYWWYSFARGYAFEIEVFRNLDDAGIRYSSHNLLDYHERRSPFDLALLGFRGDIKTSTYFLEAARTTELFCDFYITRFFKPSGVQRTWVTFLQERFWAVIADTTLPITPIAITDLAIDQSAVFQIEIGRKTLLILDYAIWKRLVANVQREGK